MTVRVLIEMDASGIRAVNVLDAAMRAYNEKLRRAVPDAEIDFEVLGVVRDAEVRAGVVAEEPEARSLTPDEINALPIGSVVMTETIIESFGAYEQRVWQKFGGGPDWQFGMPRHEWQSTDGGFERVDNADRHRGQFGFNRRVTLLWVPVKQEGETGD